VEFGTDDRTSQQKDKEMKHMTVPGSRTRFMLAAVAGASLAAVLSCAREGAKGEETAAATAEETTAPAPGESLGIASVVNLRDLGGYETADGATVRRGLVYRSNQLSDISESDMKKLSALGLKVDYDLRTEEEKEKRPDELPEGVEYVHLDVLADSPQAGPAQLENLMKDPQAANEALGDGKMAAGFVESYKEFVSLPSAQAEFRKLFLGLADHNKLPAVFHCTTGKDRTGWAAASLLTLLGVPRDVVMEDFLRSNDNILPAYQQVIDGFVAAGGEKDIPVSALGVKREYLESAFQEMETKYGTIENYFSEALGIDLAQRKALKDLYLLSS